jgi:hypothetical protein
MVERCWLKIIIIVMEVEVPRLHLIYRSINE